MNFETQTDEELVVEIGRGQLSCLAELVRRHQQRALHVAYRTLSDWQLAEDVVQEGFLRVHRAAHRYTPEAKFSTWFYRIIVNLCMDQLRRHQRQSYLAADVQAQTSCNGESPVHRQEIEELREAVKQAIDKLGKRERMAVVLHRFEGLAHGQVADIMETSAAAVESLLVRAYRKLRKELGSVS
jgi:RNA polymerase sigma-70 factor (ECF subfamily)